MLTKCRQSILFKYMTVLLPLFLVSVFYTQNSFSGEVNEKVENKVGKKVFFKGNEIEMGGLKIIPFAYRKTMQLQKDMFMYAPLPDSVPIQDRITGHYIMERVYCDTMPVAINGKPIIAYEQQYTLPDDKVKYTAPVFSGATNTIDEYLFSKLKDELDKLDDGDYTLNVNRIVIDDRGTLAYYEPKGIDLFMPSNERNPIIDDDIRYIINQKIIETLEEGISFKPALKDGKPINTRMSLDKYIVIVKNHKALLAERGGC